MSSTLEMKADPAAAHNLLLNVFRQMKEKYQDRGKDRVLKKFRKEIKLMIEKRVITLDPGETVESAAVKTYNTICKIDDDKQTKELDCPGPTALDSTAQQPTKVT